MCATCLIFPYHSLSRLILNLGGNLKPRKQNFYRAKILNHPLWYRLFFFLAFTCELSLSWPNVLIQRCFYSHKLILLTAISKELIDAAFIQQSNYYWPYKHIRREIHTFIILLQITFVWYSRYKIKVYNRLIDWVYSFMDCSVL